MRLGSVEKSLLEQAQSNEGRLPLNIMRLRGRERAALDRLRGKGLMIEVGGIWFLTDAGKEVEI